MSLSERLKESSGQLITDQAEAFSLLEKGATDLARQLQSGSRLMLWSDHVQQIITALAAAELAGADTFIAHRTIPEDEIRCMMQRFGITHLLQPSGMEKQTASPGSTSCFVHIMTSGTTRAPKVARHKLESILGSIQRTEASRNSRWLLTFPATSFAGLQVVFSAVLGGGDLVVPAERNMHTLAEAVVRHQVTHISGTPTFWRSFLLLFGDKRPPSLKQITVGGEAVDQPTLDRLRATFPGGRLTHIYASTEAGVGFSVHDGLAGIPVRWAEQGIGDVYLRINAGVLEIKSPRALKQYESGEPMPVNEDGWLSTGDLVRREGDRYIFVGRTDRRINVGGFKVTPEEVEAVLMACDAVGDVQVSGMASHISGEVLCATVVPKHSTDRKEVKAIVQKFAFERLEPFKVPRIIRVVEALQTSDSGKKARL